MASLYCLLTPGADAIAARASMQAAPTHRGMAEDLVKHLVAASDSTPRFDWHAAYHSGLRRSAHFNEVVQDLEGRLTAAPAHERLGSWPE
jgi:hypothetical protein